MVSKITVIALVAIVAAPILLGFGMNFETANTERYAPNDDPLNVTNLLAQGTTFDYVEADNYSLNANRFYTRNIPDSSHPTPGSYPTYQKTTTADSSLKYKYETGQYNGGETGHLYGTDTFSSFVHYQANFIYTSGFPTDKYLSANISYTSGGQTLTTHLDRVYSVIWESGEKRAYISTYADNAGNTGLISTVANATQIQYIVGSGPLYCTWQVHNVKNTGNTNIDINGGFKIPKDLTHWSLTNQVHNITMTLDLGSMVSDSVLYIGPLAINKTSAGRVYACNWDERLPGGVIPIHPTMTELYYDPVNTTDNCYQFTWDNASDTMKLDYVGQWPNRMGIAQSYLHYEIAYEPSNPDPVNIAFRSTAGNTIVQQNAFTLKNTAESPVIRMERALVKGFEYPVISDATYNPGTFRSNPGTTIMDITKYGTSITFGSNTYAVDNKDGTITLNGHKVPVNNLALTSHWNGARYDNAISGTVVSQSSTPATITFNGDWGASIETRSYDVTTVTETKWVPGQFSWDGVDTNFKLVGLMSSIAVFIGLSLYGRRSGARVLPLLVVCGGAALMFLVMI